MGGTHSSVFSIYLDIHRLSYRHIIKRRWVHITLAQEYILVYDRFQSRLLKSTDYVGIMSNVKRVWKLHFQKLISELTRCGLDDRMQFIRVSVFCMAMSFSTVANSGVAPCFWYAIHNVVDLIREWPLWVAEECHFVVYGKRGHIVVSIVSWFVFVSVQWSRDFCLLIFLVVRSVERRKETRRYELRVPREPTAMMACNRGFQYVKDHSLCGLNDFLLVNIAYKNLTWIAINSKESVIGHLAFCFCWEK